MKHLKEFFILCLLIFFLTTAVNAAKVEGPSTIRIRAGGENSSVSEQYTASYETGDSGDFTWTETGIISGVTISITRQPPSPYSTAQLNVSASYSAEPGTYPIIVNAYPATGKVGSRTVNITIVEQLGSIIPTSITDGKETVWMSVDFNVTGGSGNYTWSASGLPAGLSINSYTGVVSGIPALGSAGNYTTTITVTDNTPPTVSRSIVVNWRVFPAYTPLSNQGQICYVKDIVRNTSGTITSTGDLFVQNLQTGFERRITNYSTTGTGMILNPMFTLDGAKVLYTYSPDPSTKNFRVYLVSTMSTVSSENQGLILKKNYSQAIPSTMNVKYASISPDYNGTQGLIVFTNEKSDRNELWLYNFFTEQLSQLRSENNLFIRHPVFLNTSTIAFIGLKNGIQDIYIVDTNGSNYRKLTNNTPITPEYDRIQSAWRNGLLLQPLLIYSKRTYQGFSYSKWDVYITEINTTTGTLTEYSVTNTADIDEYSAAFFGDSIERDWVTLVLSSGQMFYEAEVIVGTRNVWQTNYDTIVPTDSNSLKIQRTSDATHTGLVNWSPVPDIEKPLEISIENTRLIYSKQSGPYTEIFRSDWTGSGFDISGVQLTSSSMNVNKYNPSLSKNGGLVSFTTDSVPTNIFRMNCDGSSLTEFVYDTAQNSDYSSLSPDGAWILYVKKTSINTYAIYGKLSTADSTSSESFIVGGISASEIDPPSFNPEMTKIVYSKKDPGGYFDIYYVPVNVDTIGGSISALSSPVNITNTPFINERMPSFSNTGTKIIFCSDKELGINDPGYEIYTMDISGSGIEKVVSGPGHTWPIYSPVSNFQAGTDIIGYIEYGQIFYAKLSRVTPPGSPSGQNPVTEVVQTGISPDERFSWGRKRGDGTIIATRTLPAILAASRTITYQIFVDIDEAKIPNSFTLNETFTYGTGGFSNIQTKVDGNNATFTIYEYPDAGLQTLKIVFMEGLNGGIKDHIITITLDTPASTGTQMFIGNLNYSIDGVPRTETINGNSSTQVDKPYIPVDIYDVGGFISPDGIIQDFDLLYAIDAWARDAKLVGYGITWPEDLGNWDVILLGTATGPGIIPIWLNSTYKGGYDYNPAGPGAAYEMYWEPGNF